MVNGGWDRRCQEWEEGVKGIRFLRRREEHWSERHRDDADDRGVVTERDYWIIDY
jgi:hypothetical protein